MRATSILRALWLRSGTKTSLRRLVLICAAVEALIRSSVATLTALGRALDGDARIKHRIKRIDRLLGNPRVLAELPTLQRDLARRLLRRERHPVVLIDWSQVNQDWWMLCAAIPYVGRALPIYFEVHPSSRVANRKVQHRFLDELRKVIPDFARPVIVADAGFQTPFFHACVRRGFDFVIRLRGRGVLRDVRSSRRLPFTQAFKLAGAFAKSLGSWYPFAAAPINSHRIILGAKPPSSRRRLDVYRRRAAEPWLLATSLQRESPSQIVAIYALRMQIEETFRDAKSPRFGWALDHTGSRSAERLTVLIAITVFALIAVVLVGVAAEEAKLHRSLQANTSRRRVLSVVHVGQHFARAAPLLRPRAVLRSVHRFREVLTPIGIAKPLQLRLPFPRLPSRNA